MLSAGGMMAINHVSGGRKHRSWSQSSCDYFGSQRFWRQNYLFLLAYFREKLLKVLILPLKFSVGGALGCKFSLQIAHLLFKNF